MSDGPKNIERAFFAKPGLNINEGARLAGEAERTLNLFGDLVIGYSLWGPESSMKWTKRFLEHKSVDRVGLIAFPSGTFQKAGLQDRSIAISHEVFDEKHRFMVMISSEFFGEMSHPDSRERAELGALKAVMEVSKMIDEELEKGTEIMGEVEYREMTAREFGE